MRREELVGTVLEARHRLFHQMAAGDGHAWAGADLTMAQLRGLMLLDAAGQLTVSEVADRIGTGRPAASMLVDRLVHHGLALRVTDEQDRRRALVSPTDEGRALVERLREGDRERFLHLLKALSEDDLEALARGFQALAQAAEEHREVAIAS